MAKRMKRTLSLLLTAVLLLGMLPITAAAAAESSNQQIEGGNVPVYYTYNEGTGTFAQDANPTNAVTTNKATDPEVTISKVIQGTGTENQFDITLNVTTTQKVERSPSMPDAAVALVIDKSTSMYYCVNCGKSENHRNHSVQSAGCDLCQRCTGALRLVHGIAIIVLHADIGKGTIMMRQQPPASTSPAWMPRRRRPLPLQPSTPRLPKMKMGT